jgi:hypothetical protein
MVDTGSRTDYDIEMLPSTNTHLCFKPFIASTLAQTGGNLGVISRVLSMTESLCETLEIIKGENKEMIHIYPRSLTSLRIIFMTINSAIDILLRRAPDLADNAKESLDKCVFYLSDAGEKQSTYNVSQKCKAIWQKGIPSAKAPECIPLGKGVVCKPSIVTEVIQYIHKALFEEISIDLD